MNSQYKGSPFSSSMIPTLDKKEDSPKIESNMETLIKSLEKQEKKLVKLDLGCGNRKQDGFLGVDVVKTTDVDIQLDLEKFPWDIESESVEEIYCSHYVEHTSDLFKFMNECYRILIPSGKMTVLAPYWSSVRCWMDPTHKRAISENTFLYFNKSWRESQKLDHYDVSCDFDFSYGYSISPEWTVRSEEARAFAIKHYNNVITDIQVALVKKD